MTSLPPFSGVAVRPSGPYHGDPGPPAGTHVPWHAAQPIVDLATSASSAGVTVYTIGNTYHLQGSQDHTPWSYRKTLGVVYACDVMDEHAALTSFIRARCQSSFDTTWIDFWNHRGSQYDGAGNYRSSSGDHHLHVSVRAGYEKTHTTLLQGYYHPGSSPAPVPVTSREATMLLIQLSGHPEVFKSDGFKRKLVDGTKSLGIIQKALRAEGGHGLVTQVSDLSVFGPIVD